MTMVMMTVVMTMVMTATTTMMMVMTTTKMMMMLVTNLEGQLSERVVVTRPQSSNRCSATIFFRHRRRFQEVLQRFAMVNVTTSHCDVGVDEKSKLLHLM